MSKIRKLLQDSPNFIFQLLKYPPKESSLIRLLRAQLDYKLDRLEYYKSQVESVDDTKKDKLARKIENTKNAIQYLQYRLNKLSSEE